MDKKCIVCGIDNELKETSPLCFKCVYGLPARLGYKIIALHHAYRDAITDALHWRDNQKIRVRTRQTSSEYVNSETQQETKPQN